MFSNSKMIFQNKSYSRLIIAISFAVVSAFLIVSPTLAQDCSLNGKPPQQRYAGLDSVVLDITVVGLGNPEGGERVNRLPPSLASMSDADIESVIAAVLKDALNCARDHNLKVGIDGVDLTKGKTLILTATLRINRSSSVKPMLLYYADKIIVGKNSDRHMLSASEISTDGTKEDVLQRLKDASDFSFFKTRESLHVN